jgi:hypothetical protein
VSKNKKLQPKSNRKIKDFEKQSSSGMVWKDPSEIERRKKKKIIKLVALITAAAVLLAIIGVVIVGALTVNDEGSFSYKLFKRGPLDAPRNLRIEDFDQEKNFTVFIKWDYVAKATNYTLEVEYELYPNEIISFDIMLNGRYVERKRGEMRYRVRANNLSGKGQFTEWQTLDIKPMQLALPEISLYKDETYVYFTWTKVKYQYANEFGDVAYQFADGGHFIEDPPEPWENSPQYSSGGIEYKTELSDLRDRCDIYTVKVRPLNYAIFWSDEKFRYEIINVPKLYDIYELSDTWAEAQLDLTE